MKLTPQDWHDRFIRQASWTNNLCQYLLARTGLNQVRDILDVGCGTGAVEKGLSLPGQVSVHGLDINIEYLTLAAQSHPMMRLVAGDAHHLPFRDNSLDACFCHFLLLWVAEPQIVVREMARITRSGGIVLALAEPDYGGRIDYPPEMESLGNWQTESLYQQGANPKIGRQLGKIFNKAGLLGIELGVIGGQWAQPPTQEEWLSEWKILMADLDHLPSFTQSLESLQARDAAAWERGERVLFVPTFYAWGRVP